MVIFTISKPGLDVVHISIFDDVMYNLHGGFIVLGSSNVLNYS